MYKKVLSVITFVMPSLCYATDPDFELTPFVGGKGGYQFSHDDNLQSSEPKSGVFGVYGGLQFTKTWSWDIGHQWHNDLFANATNVNISTSLWETAARYDWSITIPVIIEDA